MKKIIVYTFLLSCTLLSFSQNDKDVVGKNIDKTAKPGDDFFKYANGGWIKQNPIPNAYSQWGIGNLVQEDVWTKLKAINVNAMSSSTKDVKTKKNWRFLFCCNGYNSYRKIETHTNCR